MNLYLPVLLLAVSGTADQILKHFSHHVDVYNGLAKVWFRHINVFWKKTFEQKICCSHLSYFSTLTLHQTVLFQDMAKKRVRHPDFVRSKYWTATPDSYLSVERPTAKIEFFYKKNVGICSCRKPEYQYMYEQCFVFGNEGRGNKLYNAGWTIVNEDTRLALNFTFEEVFIPVRSPYRCTHRNLAVFASPRDKFTFCGQHSAFHRYLESQVRTHVGMFFQVYASFTVKAFYSVWDANVTQNFPATAWHPVHTQSIFLLKGDCRVYMFRIIVSKLDSIILKIIPIHSFWYEAFDGPGFRSKSLKARNDAFEASYFLCTLLMYRKSEIIDDIRRSFGYFDSFVQYSTRSFDLSQQVPVIVPQGSSLDLTLPDNKCQISSCVVLVTAASSLGINIVTNNMTYEGPFSIFCDLGGIAYFQKVVDQYNEDVCLCHQTQNRSVYIKGPEVIVMLYWFQHYSRIQVQISLAGSSCTPVSIDPCFIRRNCEGTNINTNKKELEKCIEYVTHLNKLSGVNFYRSGSELLYSLQDEGCKIFQLSQGRNRSELSEIDNCFFKLSTANINLHNKILHHHVRGLMQASVMASDRIHVSATVPLKFCHSKDSDKRLRCIRTNEYNSIVAMAIVPTKKSCFPMKTQNGSFFISIQTTTPISRRNIRFSHIGFVGWTGSWMNIQLWMSSLSDKVETVFPANRLAISDKHSWDYLCSLCSTQHDFLIKVLDDKMKNFRTEVFIQSSLSERFEHNKIQGPDIKFKSKPLKHELIWGSFLLFTAWKDWHYIALPGQVTEMFVATDDPHQSKPVTLEAVWVHNRYEEFSHFADKKASHCRKLPLPNDPYSYCLNFSLVMKNTYSNGAYYIFLSKVFHLRRDKRQKLWKSTSKLRTWNEASRMCRNSGGHLPAFYSRQDIYKLMALVKLSNDFPPVEALFIGLTYNHSTKVR